MSASFNLKNYGLDTVLNRSVNSAFKKEEIRNPAKLPHHQLRLVEKTRPEKMNGGTYFSVAAGVPRKPMFVATVKKRARNLDVSSEELSLMLSMYLYKPCVIRGQEDVKFCGGMDVFITRVKIDRLDAYCSHAMSFLFDLAQSVKSPREINNVEWDRQIGRCLQRHKWID